MASLPLDGLERTELCDLLEQLGPDAPTLLDGWTAHDLAAHIVLRERDLIAAPCIVLPEPFPRFAERRRRAVANARPFESILDTIRQGPPRGFFRMRWVRSFPNLNEFFVHHEDLRRANGLGPRTLTPRMEDALWRNIGLGASWLCRRLRDAGLDIERADTGQCITARRGEPRARLAGPPGELLLYIFGRQPVARVEVSGPPDALAAIERTHFGM
jgi:uncharacterized protein (TIGR03085 family)